MANPIFSFDVWFHGTPFIDTGLNTGTFNYWYHGSPLIIPLNTQGSIVSFGCRARIVARSTQVIQFRCRVSARSTRTLQAKGRIVARSNRTLQARARICVPTTDLLQSRARIVSRSTESLQSRAHIILPGSMQTWQSRANILNNSRTTQTIGALANILPELPGNQFSFRSRANINSIPRQYSVDVRAHIKPKTVMSEESRLRVQRTQGWPPYNTGDPGAEFFTDTSLRVGVSITAPTQSRVTVSSRASIIHMSTYKLNTRANLILNSKVQMGAMIAGRQSSGSFPCGFYIANQQTRDMVGTYSYPGQSADQTVGALASIVRQHSSHMANQYGLTLKPAIINRVQVITLTGEGSGQQVLGVGAFIQR